jgi:hypothetical protein
MNREDRRREEAAEAGWLFALWAVAIAFAAVALLVLRGCGQ